MFKLASAPASFKWPVTVKSPADNGRYQEHKFTAEFKLLDAEEQQAAQELGDAEFIREVLIGWSGIADENDTPLPFDEIARESLIKHVPSRLATIAAYFSAISGRASPRGNSQR